MAVNYIWSSIIIKFRYSILSSGCERLASHHLSEHLQSCLSTSEVSVGVSRHFVASETWLYVRLEHGIQLVQGHLRSKDADIREGTSVLVDSGNLPVNSPVCKLLLMVKRRELGLKVVNHSLDTIEVQDIVL